MMFFHSFKAFLLLPLALIILWSDAILAQSCRPQLYQLTFANQVLNITSPNFPGAYPTGSSCRYQILAPLDHIVVLNCIYELYPNSCRSTEYFQLSRDGDLQFGDASSYCGTSVIRSTSHFRSIAFGYQSSVVSQQRGRFFCQATARVQRCDCGWSQPTRITNGQEAAMHEYPSIVALRNVLSNQRVFCGGSIVSHRYILTAAHCTEIQPDPRLILALIGDHDLSSGTESRYAMEHGIQRIINHPAYSRATMANDIALLVTLNNIEWSRGVGPICLPWRQTAQSFAYLNVDVAGWGTLSFAGIKSDTLQKIELLTMDNGVCQQQYNNTLINASQICTYDYRGLGQDSCQYDSGGPVIYKQQRMFLVGIISFGHSCGARYGIGINTRTTTHLNWLRNYLAGAACVA